MRTASINQRFPDWTERLAQFFAERQAQPFAWGVQDCVSLAADAAVALTGLDPLTEYRGRYASEAEAEALMGDDDLQAFVARLMAEFGAPECPVNFAQRGDWAMVQVGNQLVTGVVMGGRVAAPGARGVAYVPIKRAICAWVI